jgi:hypothetical protein
MCVTRTLECTISLLLSHKLCLSASAVVLHGWKLFHTLNNYAEACRALFVLLSARMFASGTSSLLTFDWVSLQQHLVYVMSSHTLWRDGGCE